MKSLVILEKKMLTNGCLESTAIIDAYSNEFACEALTPKSKKIYSMRINSQHRVVYTIDKVQHEVKIWSAWSHYQKNIPV